MTSSIRRRLLSDGAWALGGKIVTMGAGILTSAILARIAEPVVVGAYFLAFNVATALATGGRFGIEKAVLQRVQAQLGAGEDKGAERSASSALVGSLLSLAVVGLAVWLGGGRWLAERVFGSPEMADSIGVLAVWVVLMGIQGVLGETFRARGNIRDATLFGGAIYSVGLLFIFSYWSYADRSTRLTAAIGATDLALAASVVLGLSILIGSGRWSIQTPSRKEIAILFAIGAPIVGANLAAFVARYGDLWIVGGFMDDSAVALYGAAARLVILVSVSLMIANQVLPPLIGNLYYTGQLQQLEKTIRAVATVAAIPSVAILSVYAVFAEQVLGFVYGTYYEGGSGVLRILAVAQAVNTVVGSCGFVLVVTGNQRHLLIGTVVGSLIGVGGSLAAVGPYGMVGVAAMTSFGVISQQVYMLLMARWKVGIWTAVSGPRNAARVLLRDGGGEGV